MRIGVTIFDTDTSISITELAKELGDRNFASLFVPEHTHIPTTRRTPYPAGGDLPPEYYRTYDPFVSLTAAAVTNPNLLVGTGICLVAQRDPIVLAKEVASLDALSNGRFVFGVGFGWNQDEMESHGVVPSTRWGVVRDKVLAMKSLWADEVASHDGKYVHITPSYSWPKPVQHPHPPVLVGGGATPTTFRHVIEWADGWFPIDAGGNLAKPVAKLRQEAEAAGRDPQSINISVFAIAPSAETLAAYEAIGVDHVAAYLPPAGADKVLPILDRLVKARDGV
jgi:probable F420-dependent oxidoreductase